MLPVAVKVPVDGSYSSALAQTDEPEEKPPVKPPAIKTWPFVSRVAAWNIRSLVRLPVAVNVPADCASTIEVQPVTPKNSSERTKVDFMFRLLTFTHSDR